MGFKILNFNNFWGFQKNKYIFGYEDVVEIWGGGHHKIGLYLGVISMRLKGFSYGQGQGAECGYFLGVAKYSNIFGVLKIPDIFGVNGRCWARAYV